MPDNKRCFIDTNVWLYALIESEGKLKIINPFVE